MRITQLIAEKNGFHWIELDSHVSFLAHTINNGKYFSVLNRIRKSQIVYSKEDIFWFEEGTYESHKDYFFTSIDELDEKIQNLIEAEMIAEKVLRDWVGIDDVNGVPVIFNKETAKTLIAENERIRNFFIFSAYDSVLDPVIEAQTSNEILKICEKFLHLAFD